MSLLLNQSTRNKAGPSGRRPTGHHCFTQRAMAPGQGFPQTLSSVDRAPAFPVKTVCAQPFAGGSRPLFSQFGGTWSTSRPWFEGPTHALFLPSHLSFLAGINDAEDLSAASLCDTFPTRPSKPVKGFCCAARRIAVTHHPAEGINNVNGSTEGAKKAAGLNSKNGCCGQAGRHR